MPCDCCSAEIEVPFEIGGKKLCRKCAKIELLGFFGSIESELKAGLKAGFYKVAEDKSIVVNEDYKGPWRPSL